jgi:hypothetical protein
MDPHPARTSPQQKESAPNPRTPRPTHNAFIDTQPDTSERPSHPSSLRPGFHPVVPPSLLRGSDRPDDSIFPDRELAANQDFVLAVLGFWLVISPWVFQFADALTPRWTAVVIGSLDLLLAFENRLWPSRYGHWATLVLGVLLFCSPFLLPGTHPPQSAANAVSIGAALVGWSGWALARIHDEQAVR